FNTISRLTKKHNTIEHSVPISFSGNDFMTFFNNKILTIREQIHSLLPLYDLTPLPKCPMAMATPPQPDALLEFFAPTYLSELNSVILSSKSSMCLLDQGWAIHFPKGPHEIVGLLWRAGPIG